MRYDALIVAVALVIAGVGAVRELWVNLSGRSQ